MKTGDAAIIAAPYADRGVFVAIDGTSIQGRDEVEKYTAERFQKAGFRELDQDRHEEARRRR